MKNAVAKAVFCAMLLTASGARAQTASAWDAKLTPAQKRLVRLCNTRPNTSDGSDPSMGRDSLRYFGKMSHRELRRALEPLLRLVPPGSNAYGSVAYTLARHGVDTRRNFWRMRFYEWRRPVTLKSDLPDLTEDVWSEAADIYEGTHDWAILSAILDAGSDGAGKTILNGARAGLLKRDPETVLRLASQREDRLRSLASLSYEFPNAIAIFKRMTHHSDARVRRAARACLREAKISMR